jgi:hypothetical protein
MDEKIKREIEKIMKGIVFLPLTEDSENDDNNERFFWTKQNKAFRK